MRVTSEDGRVEATEPETEAPVGPRFQEPARGSRLWPYVAIAATLAAIALGLIGLGLREDLSGVRAELDAMREHVSVADALRDSLSELVRDVSSLVSSSPVTLTGTSPDDIGRARVFVDADAGRTLLLVDELPVLSPDKVYQLWAIRDGEPSGAGTFRLEEAGPAWIELDESTDVTGADLLTMTVEQAPGAQSPTSDPILAGGA
jgi:hypothetical protein